MARNRMIPDSRKAGTSMGAVLVTLAVAAILAAILLGEHFGFTGLQVLETGQRIVERAEANITCTLMPLLVLAILILIILVRVSNIPEEITERMGLINLGFMIVLLATLIPTSAHPNGACMVLADQLPILHEILLFMFLLFFTILSEGVLYFAIKRMHLPKGQAERHESHLMAGMVSAAMLIAVLTLSWIIKEAETQTVSEAARLVLYFLLLALILIAIMGVEKRARAERTLQKIPHPPLKKHISRLPSIRTGLTALRLAITVGTTLAVLGALYLISGAYQRAPIIRDITLLMLYITLGGAALLAIIAILADSRKNAGKTPPAPTPRHKEPHKNIPKPAIMTTVMHAEKKIADTAEKTAKEAGNGMHKISALISRASRNAYRSITEAAHRSTRRIHESVQATHKNIRRRYAAQRAMQKEKDIMQRLEQAKKAEEERRAAAKKELEKLQEMLKEQKGKLDEADAGLKAVTEKLENKKAEKRNILASLGRIEKQMKHVRLSPDLQKEIDSEIARIHAGMKDIDSGIAALEKEHDEAAQKKAKMLAEERITENAVKEQRRKLHA